jgi:hypothetical protein
MINQLSSRAIMQETWMHFHHNSRKAFFCFAQREWKGERKKGKSARGKGRRFCVTLLAFGTSSCNAFILSAILSLRSCERAHEMDEQKDIAPFQVPLVADANILDK